MGGGSRGGNSVCAAKDERQGKPRESAEGEGDRGRFGGLEHDGRGAARWARRGEGRIEEKVRGHKEIMMRKKS